MLVPTDAAANYYTHTSSVRAPQEHQPRVKQLGAPWEENKHSGPAKEPRMPFPPQLCFFLSVSVLVNVAVLPRAGVSAVYRVLL